MLIVRGNPIAEQPQKSIYDALIEHSTSKCPYLKTTKLLEPKPTFLKLCSNYSTLKSLNMLSREAQNDFPCLLYYNNFVSLCDISVNQTVINNTVIDTHMKLYNLQDTCNALAGSKLISDFKQAESILPNLKKPDVCAFLCKEILNSTIVPICSFAVVTSNLIKELQKSTAKVLLPEKLEPAVDISQQKLANPAKEIKKPVQIEHINQEDIPIKPQIVHVMDVVRKTEVENEVPQQQDDTAAESHDNKSISEVIPKVEDPKIDNSQKGDESVDHLSLESQVPADDMAKPPVDDAKNLKVQDSLPLNTKSTEIKQEKKEEFVDDLQKKPVLNGNSQSTAIEVRNLNLFRSIMQKSFFFCFK